MKRIAFRNAHLIDPASGLDTKGGLLVENGRIADVGPRLFNDAEPNDPEVIDCRGLVLAPGLIDCRVFTGEPGAEHRESLESASAAAAAGGVTSMIVMPNTDPVIDEPSLVDFLLRRAAATAKVRVLPCAALTKGLLGETMTEIGLLQEAGAIAFTEGDRSVANARVLRRALSYAATFDALVSSHAEDPELVKGASATEGEFATRLGLPAAPAIAESMMVERDIRLVELTGVRMHFGQISTRAALDVIGPEVAVLGKKAIAHTAATKYTSPAVICAGRDRMLRMSRARRPGRLIIGTEAVRPAVTKMPITAAYVARQSTQ